jgi:hypothetical protein
MVLLVDRTYEWKYPNAKERTAGASYLPITDWRLPLL